MSNKCSVRSDFVYFDTLDTRWSDNDVYGHVNNVVYYEYFDTVVNRLLINKGWLHISDSPTFAVVAETGCRYFSSISYPETIDVGLAVERIGNTSVVYRLGIFSHNANDVAAEGRFVHVYVDRKTRIPTPIPAAISVGLKEYLLT